MIFKLTIIVTNFKFSFLCNLFLGNELSRLLKAGVNVTRPGEGARDEDIAYRAEKLMELLAIEEDHWKESF